MRDPGVLILGVIAMLVMVAVPMRRRIRARMPESVEVDTAPAPLLWFGTAPCAVFIIRLFVLQTFSIPSESMQPTLQISDRIIANKLAYRFMAVQRGDRIFRESDVHFFPLARSRSMK